MADGKTGTVISETAHAAEFGAAMRDMREAHGKSLAEVSGTLRVRQAYLAAIEEGRFKDLPGATYASGFVRAYADYLGLDVPETMRRYREIVQESPGRTTTAAPPTPVVEGRLPTGFILFVAGILALAAYGAWYYLTLHGRNAQDVVAQIPNEIASLVGGEEKPAAENNPGGAKPGNAETNDTVAAPAPKTTETAPSGDPAPASTESAAAPPVAEPTPPPAETEELARMAASEATGPGSGDAAAAASAETPGAATTPENTPPAAVSGGASDAAAAEPPPAVENEIAAAVPAPAEVAVPSRPVPPAPAQPATSRVLLRATAASWVELRRSNGDRVISQILRAGETYSVPAEGGIRLTTGNAGGIDILVDGKLLAPLGPVGAVRRDVALDPESLRARFNTP